MGKRPEQSSYARLVQDGLELEQMGGVTSFSLVLRFFGEVEQQQALVRSLFSYLVYDLDTRRIVNYR
jgi:hypothetical protein